MVASVWEILTSVGKPEVKARNVIEKKTFLANVIVSGSAIIKSEDWKETIGTMKAKCL